jgi:hypothetical protein
LLFAFFPAEIETATGGGEPIARAADCAWGIDKSEEIKELIVYNKNEFPVQKV